MESTRRKSCFRFHCGKNRQQTMEIFELSSQLLLWSLENVIGKAERKTESIVHDCLFSMGYKSEQ
jgi:hypothetical protein